jgi:hypothetical protein
MLTVLTGALAGLFHVLSGPDHLAAVAPLAVDDRDRGWLAGWTWGLGHAAGVVTVAILAVLLREWLPPVEIIAEWGERLVGAALVALGLWALRRSLWLAPAVHTHAGLVHEHLHVRRTGWLGGHAHASFYLGILHGVAGSSHFLGVLPALALPTRGASLLYIGAFAVGTVVAMTAFAAAVGAAGSRVRPGARGHRVMMATAAVLAIAVGGVWIVAPMG